MKYFFALSIIVTMSFKPATNFQQKTFEPFSNIEINKATSTIAIDGIANETLWTTATWLPMDKTWIGTNPTSADFTGRYKLLYDKNYLYVLSEITDDVLQDTHSNPLDNYYNDDCLEIFIDEDASGGFHLNNYNAFSYHLAINNTDVVDAGLDAAAHLYNNHVQFLRTNIGNVYTWEVAIKIYPENYIDGAVNIPSILRKGKKMGFAIAYCDADATTGATANQRENFIGSMDIPGIDKNKGYYDASLFSKVVFK